MVLFEDVYARRRVIDAKASTWPEVNKVIDKFIRDCNQRKVDSGKGHPFIHYYTRTWEEDGLTKIDVGSHSEFFFTDVKVDSEIADKNGG